MMSEHGKIVKKHCFDKFRRGQQMNMKIVMEPLRNSQETLEFLKSDNLRNSQNSPKFLVSYKKIREWRCFG